MCLCGVCVCLCSSACTPEVCCRRLMFVSRVHCVFNVVMFVCEYRGCSSMCVRPSLAVCIMLRIRSRPCLWRDHESLSSRGVNLIFLFFATFLCFFHILASAAFMVSSSSVPSTLNGFYHCLMCGILSSITTTTATKRQKMILTYRVAFWSILLNHFQLKDCCCLAS